MQITKPTALITLLSYIDQTLDSCRFAAAPTGGTTPKNTVRVVSVLWCVCLHPGLSPHPSRAGHLSGVSSHPLLMSFQLFLCISNEIVLALEIAIKTKSKQEEKPKQTNTSIFFNSGLERQNVSFWLPTYFYSVFPARVRKTTTNQQQSKVRLPSKSLLPY